MLCVAMQWQKINTWGGERTGISFGADRRKEFSGCWKDTESTITNIGGKEGGLFVWDVKGEIKSPGYRERKKGGALANRNQQQREREKKKGRGNQNGQGRLHKLKARDFFVRLCKTQFPN
jgi:hypothetical protein